MAIRIPGLTEDLFAMRNEQEREIRIPVKKLPIVEGRDDGLSGSRRRDDEVAVAVMPIALDHQRVEHSLLVRIWPNVQIGEGDRRGLPQRPPIVISQSQRQLLPVDRWVVRVEMLRRPV